METDSALASRLMIDFAARTGVASGAPPARYLWTDAFAVLNALDLYRENGVVRWRDLAVALIDQVHDVRAGSGTGLGEETAILRSLADNHDRRTADPLGLGGLLLDATRLTLLPDRQDGDARLINAILLGADAGLLRFVHQDTLDLRPDHRLGFHELGLAIGLTRLPPIAWATEAPPDRGIAPRLDRLRARSGTGQRIIGFGSEPKNRRASSWQAHRDINEVMLVTALLDASPGTADLWWSSRASPAGEEPFRA